MLVSLNEKTIHFVLLLSHSLVILYPCLSTTSRSFSIIKTPKRDLNNNNNFDYDTFFEPNPKIAQSNNRSPHWSMVHWIPPLKLIKTYDKSTTIETFKRRFNRFVEICNKEPQTFIYTCHRDQNAVKKISEVLEQTDRLNGWFKIKQFIYITNMPLINDVTGIFKGKGASDDIVNHEKENDYLNPISNKWKQKGMPEYFKYYYTNAKWTEELLTYFRSINFYEETGIIEQTERIEKYIKEVCRQET